VNRVQAARWLVAAQFGTIAAWLASGPWLAATPWGLGVQGAGVVLGGWAAAHLSLRQRRRFSVTPLPDRHDTLVTDGPYRRIRHPMYTSVLAVVLPAALAGPPVSVAAGIAVAAVLLAKLRFEERELARRFSGYGAYRRRSGALLPWPVARRTAAPPGPG
jgi:protein-S-isoprenylcysteine O-methyltransferase Ste14